MSLAILAVVIALLAPPSDQADTSRYVPADLDDAIAEAVDAPAQVIAMSSLLRRAARRHHPDADVIEGEAWLELLDEGMPAASFRSEAGRLLLEGGYRPAIDPQHLAHLRTLARQRFLRWMGAAR